LFKGLKNGIRRSSGSGRTARVSSTRMGHGRDLTDEQRRRPAFLPATPQEQGWDSKSPRLSGLED
jgi:hypothetical protein